MFNYVDYEPFIFMCSFEKCEVYVEMEPFGDKELIYKEVRDSVICFLYRNSFKIISWGISRKKIKNSVSQLYYIIVQPLDNLDNEIKKR